MRVSRGKVKRVVKSKAMLEAEREARRLRDSTFVALLKRGGIPEPLREYQFAAPERKWAFDFAWIYAPPGLGWVAVEVEGGVWSGGRHAGGSGMIADMEKYNEAAVRGWKVIRITPQQMESLNTVALIKRALHLT